MREKFLKISLYAIVVLFATTIVACAQRFNSNKTDTGVVINGITWATRNVDAPGTFAKTPESSGRFYQWNNKTTWNITDKKELTPIPKETEWEKAKDPSPKGWRVPTREELINLFDTAKVTNEWITQNGVNGREFTDKATGNSIFFPAAGSLKRSNGKFYDTGKYGYYWSSRPHTAKDVPCYLHISEERAGISYYYRSDDFSIRPVLVK